MKNYKIVIDASHGGEDAGETIGGITEKEFSLLLSDYLYNKLTEKGYDVSVTRNTDETLTNSNRINRIISFYGDKNNVIVISNHLTDSGIEIVYSLRDNNLLANSIASALEDRNISVEKVYQRRLPSNTSMDYNYLLRGLDNAKAVLLYFTDESNYQEYGDAIIEGIIDYTNGTSDNIYVVKSGDSLWSIAQKYGITVNELKSANNLVNNNLSIGQKLKIPAGTISDDIYIVKQGDSLWKIATANNISVSELKNYNNLKSNTLQIGQKLKLPTKISASNDKYENYIVKSGDSLYSIAGRYDTTVANLMSINNLKSSLLNVGQVIRVPINDDNIKYVVKSGDSLWSIAKKYNTTVDSIKSKNNLKSNMLQIGQVLYI